MVLVQVLYARLLDTRDRNEEKAMQLCTSHRNIINYFDVFVYSHVRYLNNNYFISCYNPNLLLRTNDALIFRDIRITNRSL